MSESFYEPDGDVYVATELTRGPWDPGAQHAGPPAALIGREVERLGGGRMAGGEGPPAQVGRITYEILRSVPIGRLRVEAEVVRPGRRVEHGSGDPRRRGGRASGARSGLAPPHRSGRIRDGGGKRATAPRPRSGEAGQTFPETGFDAGYHSAMEYRFVRGNFNELGPAVVWMRMGVPLLPGEEPTPLQRVLVAADSGNGVSVTLDWSRYLFINVDLTVHLHRMPVGEWVCLDAETFPEPTGVGMADSRLLDESGQIGRAVQTLLVAKRDETG